MSERGHISPDQLKMVRAKAREETRHKPEAWQEISVALDAIRIRPRGDFVQIESDDTGIVAIGVCRYEESLGYKPSVRVEPLADVAIRPDDSTYPDSNTRTFLIEIQSRIGEFRAAAAASGAEAITVEVAGNHRLVPFVLGGLEILDETGIPIHVDGQAVEFLPTPIGKRPPLFNEAVAASFPDNAAWEAYAERNAEGPARRRIEAAEGRLWMGHDNGWLIRMTSPDAPPDMRIPISRGAAGYEKGDPSAPVGYLQGLLTGADAAAFFRKNSISPTVASEMRKAGNDIGKNNGTSAAFVMDSGGATLGLLTMNRALALDFSDEKLPVVGYHVMIQVVPAGPSAWLDVSRIASAAIAGQIQADVEAVAASVPDGLPAVIDAGFTYIAKNRVDGDRMAAVLEKAFRRAKETDGVQMRDFVPRMIEHGMLDDVMSMDPASMDGMLRDMDPAMIEDILSSLSDDDLPPGFRM